MTYKGSQTMKRILINALPLAGGHLGQHARRKR